MFSVKGGDYDTNKKVEKKKEANNKEEDEKQRPEYTSGRFR
jgi:hypothetical protein